MLKQRKKNRLAMPVRCEPLQNPVHVEPSRQCNKSGKPLLQGFTLWLYTANM